MMTTRIGHHGGYTLLLLVALLICPSPTIGNWRLSDRNETILSANKRFELGLFKGRTRGSDGWFLGIWFKKIPEMIVWVANRESPLSDSTAFLQISNTDLLLLNQSGGVVWKTDKARRYRFSTEPLMAELLDTGNLILRYSNNSDPDGVLWQSFEDPTDTLLPGMKIGKMYLQDRFLTSWAGINDPSIGDFTYEIERETEKEDVNLLESYIYKDGEYTTARMEPRYTKIYTTTYTINANYLAVLKLSYDGVLKWLVWNPGAGRVKIEWELPADLCDKYGACGPNSYCFMKPLRTCKCLPGFHQQRETANVPRGCLRKSRLSCGVNDGFHRLRNTKLPELVYKTILNMTIGSEEYCRERCLSDCNCTAFANTELPNGLSGCLMWTGDLIDIRTYSNDHQGQHLHVKVSAAHLREISNKNKRKSKIILGLSAGAGGFLLLMFITLCFWKVRKTKIERKTAAAALELQARNQNTRVELEDTRNTWESRIMEFDVIAAATDNFSATNFIGEGGFGVVYKGILADGQEIAVKRLTSQSEMGMQGFEREVTHIRVAQHKNIVRLIGYFCNDNEKMLVYEFLENSSLDNYLFDKTRSSFLSWSQRLDITKGIARGLSYLHHDSRFRIIHLDLKPSNVLLGRDMIPKISDFGMAQTLAGDETEANATTVGGTYGYMAPEYARYKTFSVKSDVFSFGVMVLEIVTGIKSKEYPRQHDGDNLLCVIWNRWKEGKGMEILDPAIKNSPSGNNVSELEVIRCVQIGLLCVQHDAEDRPTMLSVCLMLGSETADIAQPKSPMETGSSSSSSREPQEYESSTINQMTMSVMDAR